MSNRFLTASAAVLLVLVVATAWLGLGVRRHVDRAADEQAAVRASGTVVTLLWTVGPGTSATTFTKLLGSSTGPLKAQMSQYAGTFQQVLTTQKVTSAGSVVQTGVTSLHGRRATVLVAANATITDAEGRASVRQYRMRTTVDKVGNRWLVSDLEFTA